MNFERYYIYKVTGKPQLQTIASFVEKSKQQHLNRIEFAGRHGADAWINSGHRMTALLVAPDTKMGPLWRRDKSGRRDLGGKHAYVPIRANKAGKALAQEMEALTRGDASDLARELGSSVSELIPEHGRTYLCDSQCYREGEDWILLVPIRADKPIPSYAGCKQIKLSEYFAIKEKNAASSKDAA